MWQSKMIVQRHGFKPIGWVAGAELKDAQEKSEAFQASRHFWKFDVEGWDHGLSLKDIERAIKAKTADKCKVHNFLRPGKRAEIGGQIAYLQDVKKDVRKQLAGKELGIEKNLRTAEVRYRVASKQVAQVASPEPSTERKCRRRCTKGMS